MRAFTQREKRLLRITAIALPLYLAVFYGLRGWQLLEAEREDYGRLLQAAGRLEVEILREQGKGERLERLKERHRLDPAKLRRETVVGEASAAIQKAAQARALKLGPSKESPGRGSDKELAMLQFEGVGATPGALEFVHGLGALGYPLVVDWLQLNTSGMKPGQVKLSLNLIVFDPAAWRPAAEKAGDNPAEKKRA